MIIKSLIEWLNTCPELSDRKIKVDYLGETAGNFSIYPQPCNPTVKKYTDGGQLRQYLFVFASRDYLDMTDDRNIKNHEFFEQFAQWLDECTATGQLPELDAGTAQSVEAVDSGYLIDDNTQTGAYQIQCKLIYYTDRKGRF